MMGATAGFTNPKGASSGSAKHSGAGTEKKIRYWYQHTLFQIMDRNESAGVTEIFVRHRYTL